MMILFEIKSVRTLNFPTALVNLWVPPAPGRSPMLTSGRPNLLLLEAKIRSHCVQQLISCKINTYQQQGTYREGNLEAAAQLPKRMFSQLGRS